VNRRRPLIVGVGGTLRDGSTSERALRLALRAAGAMGCSTEIFAGQAINLPPYDPADGRRSPEAWALVAALRRADGVILSSPGYHGTISGLLKNALDYTEDLRGDARVYLSERAVGVIVCADGIQAMGSTLNTLRSIAHALRAWPTPFAAVVNSAGKPFASDGSCLSREIEQSLRLVAAQVVEFAQMRMAVDSVENEPAERGPAQPSSAELTERMTAMEMTFRLMG
jgi:FMN reductase